MKVRRLEINGFKSFADRTVMDFASGMCAVVGPNGCGKSNVVDAVRWVLGEQSAKQLRGQAMEDVLFNGNDARKPAGSAEVSLVFENNGSVSHPQFSDLPEIMITRRLYRNGDSEYLINKMSCRLKDIQQLLMDTGLGNRAYAIIEQGRVAAFIEAKPEERRLWVEEAAGITRYKSQKKVSLRKMAGAKDNLDRLADIMHEVETQMGKLQRQAKKAQRHQELRQRIRELDLNISSHEYRRLSDELGEVESESEAVGAQLLLTGQRVTGLETDQETLKVRLVQAEQNIAEAGERRLKTQGAIQKAENELTLLSREAENQRRLGARYTEEQAGLKARLKELERTLARARRLVEESAGRLEQGREQVRTAESRVARRREALGALQARVDEVKDELVDRMSRASQIRNRQGDLERARAEQVRRRESLAERRSAARAEQEELEGQSKAGQDELLSTQGALAVAVCHQAEAERRAADLGRELKGLEAEEAEATRRCHSLEAAVQALKASLASFQWAGSGVRKVLAAAERNELPAAVLGLVAEHLLVEPGYEPLVEAALGPDLQALVVADGESARILGRWAAEKGLGRLRVVALAELKDQALSPPSQGRALAEVVRPEPGFTPLAALLAGAGWCPDLDAAWAAGAALAPGQSLVTSDGERINRPGAALLGRSHDEGGSVLAQRNDLAARQEELENARAGLERAQAARRTAQAELAGLDQALSELLEAVAERRRELARAEQALARVSEALGAKLRALEGLDFDAAEIEAQAERTSEEAERLGEELRACQGHAADLEQELNQRQAELARARDGLEEAREDEAQARLDAASIESEAGHAKGEASRLADETRQVAERIEALQAEIKGAGEAVDSLTARREGEQVNLGRLYEELDRQEKEHTQAREVLSQAQMQASDLDQDLKQARGEQRRVEAASNELALRQKELSLQRENLCEQVMERCRADLSACWQDCLPSGSFDPEASRERLNKLRTRLMRLGPVNMEAISEHEALSERHSFLSEQREDLEASLDDLRQAIRKINKTSRSRFTDTLEQVNDRLSAVFPVLFGGGQAKLVLDEGVDPLEAGLHLMVELPGKKLKHVESLSGGEKALSAGAVLFSLFLIRPAPFCILDEVDAPLDEANVGRFHDLLLQMSQRSQILAVTHNRRTMEIVETLYGVTMEERGISKMLSVNLEQGESMAA